jgi:peptide/nickel transport system permease protein
MFRFLARRFLLLLPALGLVSLVVFALSRAAPGDPVDILLQENDLDRPRGTVAWELRSQRYEQKQRELGLDRPIFYWSLHTAAFPDTLLRITPAGERAVLARLIGVYGNWPQIEAYHRALRRLQRTVLGAAADSTGEVVPFTALQEQTAFLLLERDTARIPVLLDSVCTLANGLGAPLDELAEQAREAFWMIQNTATPHLHRWPKIRWNGADNQYHHWIGGLLTGDLGRSYLDRRPVSEKLWNALRWTLPLNLLALPLILVLGTVSGVWSARWNGSRREGLLGALLFGLFAWPEFLMGSLLLVFLCSPDHLAWFPPRAWSDDPDAAFSIRLWHLILPVCCSVYGALAYVSRQVKTGLVGIQHQDFIRTARAKGVSEGQLWWKHAFRPALLPLATVVGGLFPRLIAGSLVVETVFSVPGSGQLMMRAVHEGDYPVICAGTMLSAGMVFVGYLLSDLLYALSDPRIERS